MSYTQEQVDALRAAIATGALEVQQGQERVRYRSLAEMERVLATAEASLAGASARRPTHFNPTFCRGG
ncbi:hypothetical protein DWF04_015770 [Cereibacter sphaeroides f. sp. denitrificans]|nr:hypothetical protein DWF04_16155 [Cereibacter sphaeroides f. sp. denitrificans]